MSIEFVINTHQQEENKIIKASLKQNKLLGILWLSLNNKIVFTIKTDGIMDTVWPVVENGVSYAGKVKLDELSGEQS